MTLPPVLTSTASYRVWRVTGCVRSSAWLAGNAIPDQCTKNEQRGSRFHKTTGSLSSQSKADHAQFLEGLTTSFSCGDFFFIHAARSREISLRAMDRHCGRGDVFERIVIDRMPLSVG
jgi:hypothetical protein